MCKWNDCVDLNVPIPANLSHTGKFHWAVKPVDSCLANVVQALNDADIYTAGCCCGHGERQGEIFLHDGTVIAVPKKQHTEEEIFYAYVPEEILCLSRDGKVVSPEIFIFGAAFSEQRGFYAVEVEVYNKVTEDYNRLSPDVEVEHMKFAVLGRKLVLGESPYAEQITNFVGSPDLWRLKHYEKINLRSQTGG